MGGHPLLLLLGYSLEGLLRDGEHPAGADGAVVEEVGAGLYPVPDGLEHQLGHELYGVPGGPVLPGLLVVLLVETSDQVLEYRPHGVVVQPWEPHRPVDVQDRFRAQVDLEGEEPGHYVAQHVSFGEAAYLVAELELVEDVLDVWGEPVQVGVEVVPKLLLRRP